MATCHDALEVNGLPGTEDGAVGEKLRAKGFAIVSRILIKVEIILRQQVVVILAQIDAEGVVAAYFAIEHSATVFVGLYRGDDNGLMLAGFVVPLTTVELHGDAFHGFPRFAVHGHHGHLVVFLVADVAKIGNLEADYQYFILTLNTLFCDSRQVIIAFL